MFGKYSDALNSSETLSCAGKIVRASGFEAESIGPDAALGDICHICISGKGIRVAAEVVELDGDRVRLRASSSLKGIRIGDSVENC